MREELQRAITAIDERKAAEIGRALLIDLLSPEFGCKNKVETDLAIFTALVACGVIDISAQPYDIARKLNITTSKVRSLVYAYRLRNVHSEDKILGEIVLAISNARPYKHGEFIAFGIPDRLLREALDARMKNKHIYLDGTFSKDIMLVPTKFAHELIIDVLSQDTQKDVFARLMREGLVHDGSFVGVLKEIVKHQIAKQAGEMAGDSIGYLMQSIPEICDHLGLYVASNIDSIINLFCGGDSFAQRVTAFASAILKAAKN